MKVSDLLDQMMKEIHECYKIAKRKHNSVCTTRSQLLYFALKKKGFEPRMLRYLTSKEQEKRVRIKLISGEMHESHVVVLLDGDILDSNLPERIPKEEYDKKMNEINKGVMIISNDYNPKADKEDLKRICNEGGLSCLFTEALKDLTDKEKKIIESCLE